MTSPKNFDCLVFDWDGTIFDSTAGIVNAVQAACGELSLPIPLAEKVKEAIGLGLNEALVYSSPNLTKEQLPKLAELYRAHYFKHDHEMPLFDGIFELIKNLHQQGFILAVATGKGRKGLTRALEQSGLTPFFAATRTADDSPSKPNPQMLIELMDELNIAPNKMLMIGDTIYDMELAKNAETSSLAVTYGAHPKEVLMETNPNAIVDSVGEMARWIAENA